MEAMAISRSALDVEWQRLQVIASNLANANTTRTADGSAFRPMRLLSGPRTSFSELLQSTAHSPVGGVQVRTRIDRVQCRAGRHRSRRRNDADDPDIEGL